jgi:hypothetical protein
VQQANGALLQGLQQFQQGEQRQFETNQFKIKDQPSVLIGRGVRRGRPITSIG